MTDIEAIKAEIINQLTEVGTVERKEKASAYHPTAMESLGVTTPDMKVIYKSLAKEIRKLESRQIIELCIELVDTRIMECQLFAYRILDGSQKALKVLTEGDVELLAGILDNWGSVDTFGVLVVGYAWREGIISDNVIETWTRSSDFWKRRLAVVCTVALNQKAHGGVGDPGRTLKICGMLADDKEDMVAKGLSWAIRELAKRDKVPVIEFMDKYRAVLPKRVIREVTCKLETGRNN